MWTDLDHVLVGRAVRVLDRRVIDVPGSDHRGVTAQLELVP
jgi:endonuclease/exonuclease/phosphatase family metal-dependent hydrolase